MEPEEYDRIAQLEGRHWWYRGMQAIAAGWLARWVWPRLAGDNGSGKRLQVLDAGCGTGGGLRWLAAHGHATGIDLHPLAVAYAGHSGQPVARASVCALPFPGGHFDLVTSFDVLYHAAIADDGAALRELARVLRPGGWLLVRVPAHDWLRGAHDRQVHTRERYSAPGLRRRLTAAGFAVRRLSYAGLWLLPPAVLRRLVQRPPAPHQTFFLLLRAEAMWLRHAPLPVGLSVVALAQRPE
jgi:SAM-dependent methyltransferase